MDIPEGSYHLFMMSSRRLFDGTHAAESYSEPRNYINLCDPNATRAFLEVTHEKYAEKLSDEFGKGIRAFFTDEPSLIAWNTGRRYILSCLGTRTSRRILKGAMAILFPRQ